MEDGGAPIHKNSSVKMFGLVRDRVRSSAFRRSRSELFLKHHQAELRTGPPEGGTPNEELRTRDSERGGYYESAESWKGSRIPYDFDRIAGLADERRIADGGQVAFRDLI